jgi:hypothetical protein
LLYAVKKEVPAPQVKVSDTEICPFCAGKGLIEGFGEMVSGNIVKNMRQKRPPKRIIYLMGAFLKGRYYK